MTDEPTDNPDFGWYEKRFRQIETTSANAASISPSGSNTVITSPATLVKGTIYRVAVLDTSLFKVSHAVLLKKATLAASTTDIQGIITEIVDATHFEFRMTEGVASVTNTTAGTGNRQIYHIGTANSEGAVSNGGGRLTLPSNPINSTQIFRDSIYFTSTSLKMPANFDKTGIYIEKSKDVSLDHMTGIEKAFLFGRKSLQNVPHPITGEDVPMRTTGGLRWFLEEYEKVDGGVFAYRQGSAAATAITDKDKRIIDAASSTMTYEFFLSLIERVFRKTNNRAHEKLVLCGNGALGALNTLLELGIFTTNKNAASEKIYGMNVVTLETLYGTLHFKTHPLFNEDSSLLYSMLITDIGNLKYRALNDRDTTLLDNRQQNDEDGRKDEWLTEAGLEVRFPESHMLINDLQTITV
tara:strand:- start:27037 stop:28269 length:1233 start_codon:yes stop_codon:yes gene_type:complete